MPPIGNSVGTRARPGDHHLLRDFGGSDMLGDWRLGEVLFGARSATNEQFQWTCESEERRSGARPSATRGGTWLAASLGERQEILPTDGAKRASPIWFVRVCVLPRPAEDAVARPGLAFLASRIAPPRMVTPA